MTPRPLDRDQLPLRLPLAGAFGMRLISENQIRLQRREDAMQGVEMRSVASRLQPRDCAIACADAVRELLLRHAEDGPSLDNHLRDPGPSAGAVTF